MGIFPVSTTGFFPKPDKLINERRNAHPNCGRNKMQSIIFGSRKACRDNAEFAAHTVISSTYPTAYRFVMHRQAQEPHFKFHNLPPVSPPDHGKFFRQAYTRCNHNYALFGSPLHIKYQQIGLFSHFLEKIQRNIKIFLTNYSRE